jgi:2-haloacid dehalogenase
VAEDCVFIDDSMPNVEAARDVGMHAIHCVEGIDLAAELRRYGFPV